jgi:RNA polymerase sigma factor (sigma-70 family)
MTEYTLGNEVIGEREREHLVKVACCLLHDHDRAEDVVQTVLLKTWVRWHQFRGESTALAWLSAALRNEVITYRRKSEYRRERAQLDETHTTNLADCGIAVERELIARFELGRVLKVLSPKLRDVVALADDDYAYGARALHLTLNNFKRRLYRVRLRARRLGGA